MSVDSIQRAPSLIFFAASGMITCSPPAVKLAVSHSTVPLILKFLVDYVPVLVQHEPPLWRYEETDLVLERLNAV